MRPAHSVHGAWGVGLATAAAIGDGMFTLSREAIAGQLRPGAPAEIIALLQTFYRINA